MLVRLECAGHLADESLVIAIAMILNWHSGHDFIRHLLCFSSVEHLIAFEPP